MEIKFATNRLEAASLDLSHASRIFGNSIGRKYIQRISILRAIPAFSDLYGFRALRLHPLKGDRSGQHALTLTGNYRLVIERLGKDKARVLSVEDYHGD